MTDLAPPTLHPTIIVGYGDHGREALRHLLSSTATRGVLQWEAARDGAGAHERRLKRLRLIHLPHAFEEDPLEVDWGDEDNVNLDLMKDLYQQIRRVDIDRMDPADALAKTLDEAATSLLAVDNTPGAGARQPLGLDVFVLVHPQNEVVLGDLKNTLLVGMERLASRPNLRGRAAGAARLNFVQFLDFDHYWEDRNRPLRRAVRNTLRTWEDRAAKGKPSFSRTWLVDGHPDQGQVQHPQRIDQLVLFLEFLLFEEQRGAVQALYQRESLGRTGIGTFGIHLIERSSGLLQRLAASIFAVQWLDYLAGETGPRSPERFEGLAQRMAEWAPQRLDELVGTRELEEQVEGSFATLRTRLAGLPTQSDNWPAEVHALAASHVEALRRTLEASARSQLQSLDAQQVTRLRVELEKHIDRLLHDRDQPVALGFVIHELRQLIADTRLDLPPTQTREWRLEVPEKLQTTHQAYRTWLLQELHPRRSTAWWPLLAVFLALVAAPLLSGFLRELAVGATSLQPVLDGLANPLLTHLGLALPALILGFWGQRQLARRVERARSFWTHPTRGRFASVIGAATSPGGAWRAPVDALVVERVGDMKASMRAAVCRELERALERLEERRRETDWLRRELRALLTNYDIDPDLEYRRRLDLEEAGKAEPQQLHLSRGPFRRALEQASELFTILELNGPNEPHFRSKQHSRRPFEGWQERYSPTFLYPFAFIDELSKEYRDPEKDEADQAHEGPRSEAWRTRIREFIADTGRPKTAFDWAFLNQDVQAEPRALLPLTWTLMLGVRDDLSEAGFTNQQITRGRDPSRGYLLVHRLGVTPDDMEGRRR